MQRHFVWHRCGIMQPWHVIKQLSDAEQHTGGGKWKHLDMEVFRFHCILVLINVMEGTQGQHVLVVKEFIISQVQKQGRNTRSILVITKDTTQYYRLSIYLGVDDIYKFYENLAKKNNFMKVQKMGTSIEKRQILGKML